MQLDCVLARNRSYRIAKSGEKKEGMVSSVSSFCFSAAAAATFQDKAKGISPGATIFRRMSKEGIQTKHNNA